MSKIAVFLIILLYVYLLYADIKRDLHWQRRFAELGTTIPRRLVIINRVWRIVMCLILSVLILSLFKG